ncbi:MAG TPA: TRAP transporter fused permease subunit [Hyphomicrobiaceae bacterium]|nr:TRAP transporter fused permease subunit [Hyphomicrobiaceae bacterium]
MTLPHPEPTTADADERTRHDDIRERLFDTDATDRTVPQMFFIALIIAFGVWHIATNLYLLEPGIWQNAIHFGGFAFLAAIMEPALKRYRDNRTMFYIDVAYGLVVLAATMWLAWAQDGIYARTMAQIGSGWSLLPLDWIAGFIVIFGAIDLTRRLTGWIIPVLVILSVAYILFLGEWLPGVFRSASLPVADVMFRSIYNDEGMFGTITTISSSNITLFMLFGGFLVYGGASDFVIELSKIIASRYRGGAAYVAVIASALTGTISGSAVANTASTGIITIPLMKRNGFRPTFAAGVEAAASTGGQLVPPIMGAGAFVMASYTGIPYGTIVAVSILPAILYFVSIAFAVRIEAIRTNLELPAVDEIDRERLRGGAINFLVPLAVMISMLVMGWTPSYAACASIAVLIVVSWMTPIKMNFTRITQATMFGIRTSVMTAILLTTIGLVNNAITTSGIGGAFSLMIIQWSQGSLLLTIVLIGLASLVLGMGLPVTAAYIILAILLAPALGGLLADNHVIDALTKGVSDPAVVGIVALADPTLAQSVATGIPLDAATAFVHGLPFEVATTLRSVLVEPATMTMALLVAHLIIFWLSQDSNVTPPVCLAAFTASGIAGSPPFQTGVASWKLSKGLYIVPLLFAYTPLITGSQMEALQAAFFALFGLYATNALILRFAEGPLRWWAYPAFTVGAIASYWSGSILIDIAGAAIVVATTYATSRVAGVKDATA